MEKAKFILEEIVGAIVSDPSQAYVESRTDDMGVLLTLHVAQPDMGKIIGKAGETAKALRSIVKIIGLCENARVTLKIAEPK